MIWSRKIQKFGVEKYNYFRKENTTMIYMNIELF